jgi:hypothetical protein
MLIEWDRVLFYGIIWTVACIPWGIAIYLHWKWRKDIE